MRETLGNAAHIEINTELNIRGYQNAYQKKFREEHPNYYKYFQRYRLDKKRGKFEGTFKEWQIKNGVEA